MAKLPYTNDCNQGETCPTMTYKTGAVRYRGVYLDGVYTRQMALAIKNEVESILKFFEHTDNALKKSMKEKNNG